MILWTTNQCILLQSCIFFRRLFLFHKCPSKINIKLAYIFFLFFPLFLIDCREIWLLSPMSEILSHVILKISYFVNDFILKMTNTSDDRQATNLKALRNDVTETTEALKATVEKLVDREDRLHALNARADDLNSSSYHFHGSSRRLQRRMKWQSYKMTIIISGSTIFWIVSFIDWIFLVAVVVIVIGLIVLVALHPWKWFTYDKYFV